MKKFLFVIFALLLFVGVANATGIPVAVDPQNYPTVWTELVYNGSGSTIYSGFIVEWDFEASDSDVNYNDDMCTWVKTANGASDVWTAGVVPFGQNINNGGTGAIIIRGPAYIVEDSTPPAADNLCATTTSGKVSTDAASANTSTVGICIDASPSYAPRDETSAWSIVYVNPVVEAD